MSLSTVTTIIAILNGSLTFLKGLFGWGGGDRSGAVVAKANAMNGASAAAMRETAAQTEKDIENVENETRSDLERVRVADSLLDQRDAVQQSIDRINRG